MVSKGYIKRPRAIYDWYEESKLDIYSLAVYDYLLTFAREEETVYRGIKLKKGQLIRSGAQIAKALKISRVTVIRRMKDLKEAGAIDIEQIENGTSNIITVNSIKNDTHETSDEKADQSINLDELLSKLD